MTTTDDSSSHGQPLTPAGTEPTAPPTPETASTTEAPPAVEAPVEIEVEAPAPEPTPEPAAEPTPEPAPAAPAATDTGEAFDPAADLPAYREGMNWFVLRVASNKENYVRETLLRKVQIEGLETRVGRIMVPTEKTKTLKAGKTRITETKLYPGYVFVEMALEPDGRIPQDVFFLIKETTGVGDFVGTAGRPTPMAAHEVEKNRRHAVEPPDFSDLQGRSRRSGAWPDLRLHPSSAGLRTCRRRGGLKAAQRIRTVR